MGYLMDCTGCRSKYDRLTRQYMRCGWERPIDPTREKIPARAWVHQGFKPDVDANGQIVEVSTCPGYTCGLPEVIEGARARMHWEKGQLLVFTGGERATESLLRAVETFDTEVHRLEAWRMTPKEKGGGGA